MANSPAQLCAQFPVSDFPPELHVLKHSAAELESHITHCGDKMMAAYASYAATGCFAARGSADGYRMQMERAIAQRSALVVASMELERGLV